MSAKTAITYRDAFPDFGEMDVEIPAGFADVSFRNDACPVFASEELGLFLHVDYKDAELREFQELKRFSLVRGTPDAEHGLQTDMANETILETDDFEAVVQTVERLRAEAAMPTP